MDTEGDKDWKIDLWGKRENNEEDVQAMSPVTGLFEKQLEGWVGWRRGSRGPGPGGGAPVGSVEGFCPETESHQSMLS